MKSFLAALFIIFTFSSFAQVNFEYDFSIPVTQNGQTLARAFEGGLNSAQFQSMDLNSDNINDLVIFNRNSRNISTYLNVNDRWVYEPKFAYQFPEDVTNWLVLKDYDCDGKKDLFTSTTLGIKVYRNISTNSELSWQVASEFLIQESGTNIQVSSIDIPGFADINGDGALDILTYRFGSSGSIDYYENTGSCGDLTFTRVTRSWGDFFDCGCNDFSFEQPCASSDGMAFDFETPMESSEVLHAGGKTILPFDADNDGDLDIVISDELCENLVFLSNEGTASNAIMTNFDSFPVTDPVNFQFFPSAFLEDIDFDGIEELIVSTNVDRNLNNRVNFQTQIRTYENLGSNEVPNFDNPSPFLQNEMIEVGEDAYPTFLDFDQDGDLDLFVGNKGNLINDILTGTIWHYENTGNRFNPRFELVDTDFASLANSQFTYLKPQFADMDGDGEVDLIIQALGIDLTTKIFFLKGDANLNFGNPVDLGLSTTESSNPMVFDINSDGRPDILAGNQFGSLTVFLNQGNLTFSQEDGFGGIENDFSRQNLSVAIGKFEPNGNNQLVSLDSKGQIRLYEDQADANFRASSFEENLLSINEDIIPTKLGRGNFLAAADLYGEGIMSIMVGTARGGFIFLRNKTTNGSSGENELRVSISPNPSSDKVRILTNANAIAEIIDLSGKVIESEIEIRNSIERELDFGQLPAGVYLIRLTSEEGSRTTRRILIQP